MVGRRLSKLAAVAALGAALVALELRLRGEVDVTTEVVGQLAAFALFCPAAVLCWRGLGAGRLGLALVLLVAVALRAAVFQPSAPAPLTRDLNRYAWDARVQAQGVNPYRFPPSAPALRSLRDREVWDGIALKGWRTPYPPVAQGSFLLGRTIFGGGLRATTWLFLAAEAGAVALLVLVLGRSGLPRERILVYAWHPLAVSEIAANGHVDALVVLALALLLAAWQSRRFAVAGAAAAAAVLVKLTPLALVPALMRGGGRRFAVSALVLLPLAYLPYFSVGAGVLGSIARFQRRLSFGSLEPPLANAIGHSAALVLAGITIVLVVAGAALREHDTPAQVSRTMLLVLGTMLVVGQYVQPWYALALLPALVLVQAPGWLWLTGTIPLLYLYELDGAVPVWVRPTIYGPLAGFALLSLLRGRRRRPATALSPLRGRPRIAAVIPVLDEEQALPGVLAEIPAGLVDEVVVVDGGSRDDTVAAARAHGALVVVEPRRGYGRACGAGAAATTADVIVFLDGDGSDNAAWLPRVLAPLLAGEAALALGARREAERGTLLAHQRAGNRLVAWLIGALYGVSLSDIPPMRAVRRDVLERLALREMTYGWPTEMIVKCARAQLPVAEVAVPSRRRRGGESKIAGRLWPSARAGALMLAVVIRHA